MPFGMVMPVLALDTVPSDGFKLNSKHSIRSYTLNSPLMSGVRLNKDNFNVPLRALYRDAYDILFQHPQTNTGSEYIDDENYAYISHVDLRKFYTCFVGLVNRDIIARYQNNTAGSIDYGELFTLYQCVMQFASSGGLFKRLGINTADFFELEDVQDNFHRIDDLLELVGSFLANATFKVPYGDGSNTVDVNLPSSNPHALYRYFGMLCDRYLPASAPMSGLLVMLDISANESAKAIAKQITETYHGSIDPLYLPGAPEKFSLHRLFAYQAVVHHFYTNDKIDGICNNNEYVQRMLCFGHGQLYDVGSLVVSTFECNGARYPVPYCAHTIISQCCTDTADPGSVDFDQSKAAHCAYILSLFLPAFALRESDYFTGSRLRPIAMGDSSADVVGEEVSAIEVTRAIQAQRFLNMVNRSGRRISKYFKDLFGVAAGADIECNPQMLSHNECRVESYEVENTANNQGNITTNIRTTGGDYEFDFDVKDFGVILTLVSFTAETVYGSFVDRITQQISLPDMYNPFLQFLGDQNVQNYELGPLPKEFQSIVNASPVYGYQSRDMQYKQHVSVSDSGFNYNLPSYALIRRTNDNNVADVLPFTQSSLTIRHYPDEFDQFFNSLTYSGLAGYFHFIIRFDFNIEASRPMAYDAQILQ